MQRGECIIIIIIILAVVVRGILNVGGAAARSAPLLKCEIICLSWFINAGLIFSPLAISAMTHVYRQIQQTMPNSVFLFAMTMSYSSGQSRLIYSWNTKTSNSNVF